MKVYQVTKSYFDGDHEHGKYKSSIFSNREAAEEFSNKVWGKSVNSKARWWSDIDRDNSDEYKPFIEEIEIQDSCPKVTNSEDYLDISYT